MTIEKVIDGDNLTVVLGGRLDTNTAPLLESEVVSSIDSISNLIIDMKELVYISSAGLRVLLSFQKQMSKKGELIIRNVCNEVMEIFEVTGFDEILTIE